MKNKYFFSIVVILNVYLLTAQNIQFENESLRKIIEITKEKNKSINHIDGYRIQIFSGNHKDCQQIESKFRDMYPSVRILKKVENPFYKLWIGVYKDQFVANYEIKKYMTTFKSSIVIPDKIYYSEL